MRYHNVPRDMQRHVQRWYDYAWSRLLAFQVLSQRRNEDSNISFCFGGSSSRALCLHAYCRVMSVRLSVTRRHCAQTAKGIFKIFSPPMAFLLWFPAMETSFTYYCSGSTGFGRMTIVSSFAVPVVLNFQCHIYG